MDDRFVAGFLFGVITTLILTGLIISSWAVLECT